MTDAEIQERIDYGIFCAKAGYDRGALEQLEVDGAYLKKRLAEEREECAKIAEWNGSTSSCNMKDHAYGIAAAIRARQ